MNETQASQDEGWGSTVQINSVQWCTVVYNCTHCSHHTLSSPGHWSGADNCLIIDHQFIDHWHTALNQWLTSVSSTKFHHESDFNWLFSIHLWFPWLIKMTSLIRVMILSQRKSKNNFFLRPHNCLKFPTPSIDYWLMILHEMVLLR